MKFWSKTTFFACLLLLSNSLLFSHDSKKIVGLMEVRNEENIIEQHLRALAYYTDAIVVVDDASDDMTPIILEMYADEFKIEKIITNKISSRECGNESENSQLLLDAGRAIGGTHFIILDADEMFTANCLDNNFLRNSILSLKTGDSIELHFVTLWQSTKQYQATYSFFKCIFCDDKQCSYPRQWLHASRIPMNLTGIIHQIKDMKYSLLHFQCINWQNLLIKQAWYRCLEIIRNPQKSVNQINQIYGWSKYEQKIKLKKCPYIWFKNYSFFDPSIYNLPEVWRKQQVREWFSKYGKDYFRDLNIWDINWYE